MAVNRSAISIEPAAVISAIAITAVIGRRIAEEARRVLRPGGHLIFNVWNRISENEFADIIEQALAAIFPADPPRFLARIPMSKLKAAGVSDISVAAVDETSKAASPRDPAIGFCQGTPAKRNRGARRGRARTRHRARRRGTGAALWQRPDRRAHPGDCDHGELALLVPSVHGQKCNEEDRRESGIIRAMAIRCRLRERRWAGRRNQTKEV